MPEQPQHLLLLAIYAVGLALAVDALRQARTPQGAIAWVLALVFLPLIGSLSYLLLGRSRFQGYVRERREGRRSVRHLTEELYGRRDGPANPDDSPSIEALERLGRGPFLSGNDARLLVDGPAFLEALLEAVRGAEHSILVQSYILRDDAMGRQVFDALAERARAGVPVWLLFDAIGSLTLSRRFLRDCEAAGIRARSFGSSRPRFTPYQWNFRNHRKVVVVDGRVGLIGGMNIGDEYMGRDAAFGRWRDTHLRLEGPAALALQVSFVEDWHWATGEVPELDWTPPEVALGDEAALVLPMGPADEVETCQLLFVGAIHAARERLWIATPYFVPDSAVLAALQLAALRGVDVRLLITERADSFLVDRAAYAYLEPVQRVGVRIFRYTGGFLHQKVMLVDDRLSVVGTANLDNRSMRLNFEVAAAIPGPGFALQVEAMLAEDLERSLEVPPGDLAHRSLPFRLGVWVARLFAPIL